MPPTDLTSQWTKAKMYLRCVLTKRTYELAITPARLVSVEADRVVVAVPTAALSQWLGGLQEMHAIARDIFNVPAMVFTGME